jgi:hypothetical protein
MESGVALRFPPQSKNSSRVRETPACSDVAAIGLFYLELRKAGNFLSAS